MSRLTVRLVLERRAGNVRDKQELKTGDSDGGRLDIALAIVAVSILAIHLGIALTGQAAVFDGEFLGPDSYMRLNRVLQLWQLGDWLDPVYHRINAPLGHIQHWTRPMDLLLSAGALVGAPFAGFEAALRVWAALVNPAMHVAALLALVWGLKGFVKENFLWLVAFLFILQLGMFNAFIVGRPDHQGLIQLCIILQAGLFLKLLADPTRLRIGMLAGLISGLALWISVETLLVTGLGMVALGLRWLFYDRETARALAVHSLATATTIFLALIIEHGASGFSDRIYDQISIAHLGLFVVNTGFWLAVMGFYSTSARAASLSGRIVVACLLAALAGAVLGIAFPGFFASPLAGVDPLYRAMRLEKIEEIMPLINPAAVAVNGLATEVARAVMTLGIALVALPWLLWQLAAKIRGGQADLWQWVYLGLGLCVFVPMTLAQSRWSPYGGLFALIVYTHFACRLVAAVQNRVAPTALSVVRPLLVVALVLWPISPFVAMADRMEAQIEAKAAMNCDIGGVAVFLGDPGGLGATRAQLMAFVDYGPELLYRTPHSVLAIPNHRPQPGFTASYQAMTATDMGEAEAILRGVHTDLVLVCDANVPRNFYGSRASRDGESDTPTLHEALNEGAPPAFLSPVALPPDVGPNLKLYAVAPE